jgi:hypothetical protein
VSAVKSKPADQCCCTCSECSRLLIFSGIGACCCLSHDVYVKNLDDQTMNTVIDSMLVNLPCVSCCLQCWLLCRAWLCHPSPQGRG